MMNGSNEIGALGTKYEFFPSVREGYRPSRVFGDEDLPLTGRTAMTVDLTAQGVPADGGDWEDAARDPSADLRMYGPGDVTGIDERQIVGVQPEPNTSTFAPNYFPMVELDRADLPWLFSPERADLEDGGKARPWLALVVVERSRDDVTVEADGTKPLPALTTPTKELPPIEETWAWAHVQVVGMLSDQEKEAAFTGPSEQVVSRLLCPRNLDANTRYLAAIVPTFEPGVRAGLGEDPFPDESTTPELRGAWDRSGDEPVTLPVYYRWQFTTGEEGDFESLVRKLDPTRLDKYDVGVREIDVHDPGPEDLEEPDGLTRVVGGALQSPGLDAAEYPERDSKGRDRGKRKHLRDILNDPASAPRVADAEVPVIGPPIYGQWYLPEDAGWDLGTTGLPEPPGIPESPHGTPLSTYFGSWLHGLNLDPQYRIPASYGTEVVQENQERLMAAAWKMFGDLAAANERIGHAQVADLLGRDLSDRLDGVDPARFARRLVDPIRLQRRLEQAEYLQRNGLLSGEDLVAEVMGGETRPIDLLEGVDSLELDIEDGPDVDGVDLGEIGLVGVDERTGGDVLGRLGDVGAVDGDDSRDGRLGGLDRGDTVVEHVGRMGIDGDDLHSAVGDAMAAVRRRVAMGDGDSPDRVTEGDLIGDGAGSLAGADTLTQLTRLGEINSSAFRRLTRPGGKLARGVEVGEEAIDVASERASQPFSFGSRGILGNRFADVSERIQPDEVERAPEPVETNWWADETGTVLSLETAADRSDGRLATVPEALLAIERVRDRRDAVRERLAELEAHLAGVQRGDEESTRTLRAALTDRPTVGQTARAIVSEAYDDLFDRLAHLVAVNPEPLADEFTVERGATLLSRFRSAHAELVGAVDEATAAVRDEEFAPSAVVANVDTARAALARLSDVLDAIEGNVDPSVSSGIRRMQTLSADMSGLLDALPAGPRLVSPGVLPAVGEIRDLGDAMVAMRGNLDSMLLDGYGDLPGLLDASGWSKQAAAWRINPGLLERPVELAPILAAPEFEQPMYEWLKRVDQCYLLPGAENVPVNVIGTVETSSTFIESFMCGLNHEMGRELLWRKFPSDRRGTYFRQFWDYVGQDDRVDVEKLHRWQDSELGDNRAGDVPENRVVMLLRGELLDAYPDTRIYAVKAIREDRSDDDDEASWDRMPLLEKKRQDAIEERRNDVEETLPDYSLEQLQRWEPKKPIFGGTLDPDITFLGFDLSSAEAHGRTLEEYADGEPGDPDGEADYGWFFVLEEPAGKTKFGLDVPAESDYGEVPKGVEHGPGGTDLDQTDDGEEYGWNALSWGHLVDDADALDAKAYVSVAADNPAGDGREPWATRETTEWSEAGETYDYEETATWGTNSAHMASITWQLPVRICIHADDVLPHMVSEEGDHTAANNLAAETLSDSATLPGWGED